MAILKQRLNMKNETGSGYDTLHLETSSDLVQRDDGTSVEDALNTLTTNVTNLSTSVENVTNNITTEVKTIIQEGNATHAETHATGGSDEITPDSIGALSATGTAESAKKLETTRTFQVNLGSTSSAGFDGTGNVTPGVTGTLGVSNGGTGKTTAPLGLYNLINGCSSITSDSINDTDVIPIGDASAATAKSSTVSELKNIFNTTTISPELISETTVQSSSTTVRIALNGIDWDDWSIVAVELRRTGAYSSSNTMWASFSGATITGTIYTNPCQGVPGPRLLIFTPWRSSANMVHCLTLPVPDVLFSDSGTYADLIDVAFTSGNSTPAGSPILIYGIR